MFSVCLMNVHTRCKDNVANTCGINPAKMAEILHDMVCSPFGQLFVHSVEDDFVQGMSVNKINVTAKEKDKKKKRPDVQVN